MAEENKEQVTTPGAGATPAIDETAIRRMIAETVQQEMNSTDKGYNPAIQTQQPQYQAPVATENPLKSVLDPIYGKDIAAARLDSAVAKDASLFYATTPDAIPFMKELEEIHRQRLLAGIPDTHETVWLWYKGKNIDKFIKEAKDRDAAKIAGAQDLADGAGGARPAGSGQLKDAFAATDDELKQHLANRPF